MEDGGVTNDLIHQRRDDIKDTEALVDTSLYKLVATFGAVAFPPGMPEWLQQYILDSAEQARNADDFLLDPNSPEADRERKKREQDQGTDTLSLLADIAQEQAAWLKTSSTLAGVTMTGDEWQQLSGDLKQDSVLRDWLIDQMIRDGKTRDQAEKKVREMADVYAAMAKPPSQRTDEERDAIKRADSDPEFRRYTQMVEGQRGKLTAEIEKRTSFAQDRAASVEDGSDLFASAPDLSNHHRIALAATQPLPAPPSVSPSMTPAPQPVPGMAGLDI